MFSRGTISRRKPAGAELVPAPRVLQVLEAVPQACSNKVPATTQKQETTRSAAAETKHAKSTAGGADRDAKRTDAAEVGYRQ
jgi:hypothetical protein